MKIKQINGLKGVITVPGDKSISHRAVMLGALAKGTTHITGFLKTHAIISNAHKISNDNDIFKIFLTSLNHNEVLETFIFFERIAFREPLFLKNMPPSLSTEWSNLFQILWEICSTNPKLLDQLLEFDPLKE